jgi:hypothetical protein
VTSSARGYLTALGGLPNQRHTSCKSQTDLEACIGRAVQQYRLVLREEQEIGEHYVRRHYDNSETSTRICAFIFPRRPNGRIILRLILDIVW